MCSVWSGDDDEVEPVTAHVVAAAGQIAGMDLLDVATGTGDAALLAAAAGAAAVVGSRAWPLRRARS